MRDKQNRSNKRYRTKEKFKELYNLKMNLEKETTVVFGTITLNNEILNQKENTYIKKIHKWLKQHFLVAILNKDYGSKTNREHYHFLGITAEEVEKKLNDNGKPKKSSKGYIIYELKKKDFKEIAKTKEEQFEPTLCIVDFDKNDIDKTTKYLLKLNNHSNKFMTKSRVRVIKSPLMRLIKSYRIKDIKIEKE